MADPTAPTLERELRALDRWWREAGVDQAFSDAPQGWLADPADDEPIAELPREAAGPAAPPPELLAGGPDNWPTMLAEFDAWWLAEPTLALGAGRRIAPRGPANPALMVLVPQPEAEDASTLLSGPQGALLGNMLAAMGLAAEQVRIAALLPAHLPHPDWRTLDNAGWGALARRHIALAAPRRLLVLGRDALSLLGHDPAQDSAPATQLALEGGTVPVLAARGLEALLQRPKWQAGLWQRWLEWTDGDA